MFNTHMKRVLLKYYMFQKETLQNLALQDWYYCFNGVKRWNKFHFELSNKETNFPKSKLKTLLKAHFLSTCV